MVLVRPETAADLAAREMLLDRVLPARHTKPSELLRAGRLPARGLALVACQGDEVVGSVRLWHILAGDRQALLLGPLGVSAEHQGCGIGRTLMREAIWNAAMLGHDAILLVGDPEYYERFGFSAAPTRGLVMPKPVEARRFLAMELHAGALAGASGPVLANGRFAPAPAGESLRLAA